MIQKLERELSLRLNQKAYESIVQFSNKLQISKGELIRRSINELLHRYQREEREAKEHKKHIDHVAKTIGEKEAQEIRDQDKKEAQGVE